MRRRSDFAAAAKNPIKSHFLFHKFLDGTAKVFACGFCSVFNKVELRAEGAALSFYAFYFRQLITVFIEQEGIANK